MSDSQELDTPRVENEEDVSTKSINSQMKEEKSTKPSNLEIPENPETELPKMESTNDSTIEPNETSSSTVEEIPKDPENPGNVSPQSPTIKTHERNKPAAIKKPLSPFAKFRQLDRQNSAPSSPSTPKSPGKDVLFKFTDPIVQNNAVQIKERLLSWCKAKTTEYENVQLDNFSTSWSNGLAFCALLHHFRPNAFDYHSLRPEDRRKNFELAFTKADEIAGIAPLLDVEDMVMMRRPDWKCVFTYVQSIHRRFKDED